MCYNISMKILLSILILTSFVATTNAATLVPSLQVQMQRQESINKKNTLAEKRAAAEARKQAYRNRLATLRLQRAQENRVKNKTVTQVTVVTQPTPSIQPQKQQTIVASNTLTTTPTSQMSIANVDMTRVRSSWLTWYNDARGAK